MTLDQLFQKAVSLHQQQRYTEAADAYRQVLKKDANHLDANYLLGTLYSQTGKNDKAEQFLKRAEQIRPNSPFIKVNLGNIYKEKEELDKARDYFETAIRLKPDIPQAHFGLGAVYEGLGEPPEKTSTCYFTALELNPNIPEVHQAIGRLHAKADNPDALKWFENARKLNPDTKGLSKDIGMALLNFGRIEEAAFILKKASKESPDAADIKYFLAIAEGKDPSPAIKEEYVRNQFNHFAKHFEHTLVTKLNYNPATLVTVMRDKYGDSFKMAIVVDLGCGTGLTGVAIRPHTDNLIGIDLSEKMIESAKAKKCYDTLIQGDIINELKNMAFPINLIIAADVLVYIGDVSTLIETAKIKLAAHGVIAFTTEKHEGEGVVLKPSGRYAHSAEYIAGLAAKYGFTIVEQKEIDLRKEGSDMIKGHAYLLELQSGK